MKMRFFCSAVVIAVSVGLCQATTLRMVDWNITASDISTPRSGFDTILEAMGVESVNGFSRPLDLMMFEEVNSQQTTSQAVANALNNFYGGTAYKVGTINGGSTGSGTQGVVYNSNSLSLIGEAAIGIASSNGGPRQTLRYEFRPVGGAPIDDFYTYVSHWKADTDTTSQNRRRTEANFIRNNADALGSGIPIIYTGDYNLYTSSETAYQRMMDSGNGHANDPLNRPGDWHAQSQYRDIDTQAPAQSPPGGLTGGGLDDRFDFQLVSDSVLGGNVGSLKYVAGSYHTFGNNGSVPVNGSINSPSNTALGSVPNRTQVLNLLTTVADHLPVLADYNVLLRLPGDADANGSVDVADFTAFFANFGATSGVTYATGDFDSNGVVDVADFTIFFSHFGQTGQAPTADMIPFMALANVPEPASLAIAALVLWLPARRRARAA